MGVGTKTALAGLVLLVLASFQQKWQACPTVLKPETRPESFVCTLKLSGSWLTTQIRSLNRVME